MTHISQRISLFHVLTATSAGLCALLLFSMPAKAATVSVREIIKQPSAQPYATISLHNPEIAAFPANNGKAIAFQPLFLTSASLLPTKQETIVPTKDPTAIHAWVTQYASSQNKEAESARMIIANGRVTDFSPGKDGTVVDTRGTTIALLNDIDFKNSESPVVGFFTKPTHTLADTNTLGIEEFLAGGISDFANSTKNRQANIEAGMQQVKGVLIKPGEIFSFGEYLGDVTAAKGFKPEIVIKADGLKPELGGGICQVSSTLFRAVMASGMEITQRKNHSFAVSHYSPVGTDATIYTPAIDLKFKNDTPGYVLVWPHYPDKTHLEFDLYGTSDGRTVVVDQPKEWDRKANGAVKTSWTRHVTKNGITRDDTMNSNYLPPALFRKTEQFVTTNPAVPNTPAPTPTPSGTAPIITPTPTATSGSTITTE